MITTTIARAIVLTLICVGLFILLGAGCLAIRWLDGFDGWPNRGDALMGFVCLSAGIALFLTAMFYDMTLKYHWNRRV